VNATPSGIGVEQTQRRESLMERAGYLVPGREHDGGSRKKSRIFAIDDLTPEEEKELLKYLEFLRSRGTSSGS
jgi:hypothetical protein